MMTSNDRLLASLRKRLSLLSTINAYQTDIEHITLSFQAIFYNKLAAESSNQVGSSANQQAEIIAWEKMAYSVRSLIAKINAEENRLAKESNFEVGYHAGIIEQTDNFSQKIILRNELEALLNDIYERYPDIKPSLCTHFARLANLLR